MRELFSKIPQPPENLFSTPSNTEDYRVYNLNGKRYLLYNDGTQEGKIFIDNSIKQSWEEIPHYTAEGEKQKIIDAINNDLHQQANQQMGSSAPTDTLQQTEQPAAASTTLQESSVPTPQLGASTPVTPTQQNLVQSQLPVTPITTAVNNSDTTPSALTAPTPTVNHTTTAQTTTDPLTTTTTSAAPNTSQADPAGQSPQAHNDDQEEEPTPALNPAFLESYKFHHRNDASVANLSLEDTKKFFPTFTNEQRELLEKELNSQNKEAPQSLCAKTNSNAQKFVTQLRQDLHLNLNSGDFYSQSADPKNKTKLKTIKGSLESVESLGASSNTNFTDTIASITRLEAHNKIVKPTPPPLQEEHSWDLTARLLHEAALRGEKVSNYISPTRNISLANADSSDNIFDPSQTKIELGKDALEKIANFANSAKPFENYGNFYYLGTPPDDNRDETMLAIKYEGEKAPIIGYFAGENFTPLKLGDNLNPPDYADRLRFVKKYTTIALELLGRDVHPDLEEKMKDRRILPPRGFPTDATMASGPTPIDNHKPAPLPTSPSPSPEIPGRMNAARPAVSFDPRTSGLVID